MSKTKPVKLAKGIAADQLASGSSVVKDIGKKAKASIKDTLDNIKLSSKESIDNIKIPTQNKQSLVMDMQLFGNKKTTSSNVTKGATKAPISQMTNEQLVQEIATRAENKIGVTGRIAGTQKHAYSQKLLDRYQRIFGDRGLRTETTWLGGNPATYGTKGSARIDVLDTINNTAYDYKFKIRPGKGLSQRQINKIFNNGPSYLQYVKEVNP